MIALMCLGYSKDEGKDVEYWKSQLQLHQKCIDIPKALVLEVIENLSKKGVNVREIEQQTQATEDRIAELDKRLEDLPETKRILLVQYQKEKHEQLKANAQQGIIKDRAIENTSLFAVNNTNNIS